MYAEVLGPSCIVVAAAGGMMVVVVVIVDCIFSRYSILLGCPDKKSTMGHGRQPAVGC